MDGTDTVAYEPLLLTIPQVMKSLGLGRTKVYQLIDKEGFPVIRFGRAVRVSYTSLQEWLKQREERMEYN
jgi:excisionase family DNA binding protein